MVGSGRRGVKRRRVETNRTTAVVPRRVSGIPNETFVKLYYADSDVMTSAAGTPVSHVYRANSLFDPDYTGTGSQPVGFDQYAALYGRYCVYKVQAEVEALVGSALSTQWSINLQQDLNYPTTMSEHYADISTEDSAFHIGGYANVVGRFKRVWNLASKNGVTLKEYLSDDRFQAAVGNNPSETMGIRITASPIDGAASACILGYTVKLTYWAKFYDRQVLNMS